MKTGKFFSSTGKFFTTLIFSFLLCVNTLANDTLVFGLTGTVYKGDLKVFNEWKKYLEKKINTQVEIKFSRSYSEMISMIQRGDVDIAYVCNTTYIKLRDQKTAKLLAIPQTNNQDVYYAYIIAKKGKTYNSLFDFRDKLFAYTDPGSNSGAIAATYKLLKEGIKPHFFFSKIIYTYEHSESINAVIESFVDGASVDSLVYEQFVKRHPKKAQELQIVEKLGPFSMSPLVSNTTLDEKLHKKIQDTFVDMNKTDDGKKILEQLSLSQLKRPSNETYEDIEEMLHFLKTY